MQDPENDRPNHRAEKYRTWKVTDQIAGLKNIGRTKSHAGKYRMWKMTDQITGLENTGHENGQTKITCWKI